jgi:hypothetical protein
MTFNKNRRITTIIMAVVIGVFFVTHSSEAAGDTMWRKTGAMRIPARVPET